MIVRGHCCPSEVPIIEQIIVSMPGVTSVRVNVIAKKVVVEHENGKAPAATIVDALNRAHIDAFILAKARGGGAGGDGGSSSDTAAAAAAMSGAAPAPPRPRWNVMLAALLWIVSLISHGDPDSAAANATTPASVAVSTAASTAASAAAASAAAAAAAVGHDVRHDAAHGLQYLKYVALGAVALTLPPLFPRALSSLRQRIVDINVLLILAVVGAIAIGDYTEAAAVAVLFTLSDYLEMRATAKVRNEIASLVALCPQTAVLADTGESVLVEDLGVGVSVLVRSGYKVPVDGVVLVGRSAIDESNLTGESRPVAKGKGDTVSAGTVNVGNSTLTVESRALANDSAVARLVKLVEDAQMKRSPTEQLVQSVAK
jgi:Cd2+/Zn2+-exporting ATPase